MSLLLPGGCSEGPVRRSLQPCFRHFEGCSWSQQAPPAESGGCLPFKPCLLERSASTSPHWPFPGVPSTRTVSAKAHLVLRTCRPCSQGLALLTLVCAQQSNKANTSVAPFSRWETGPERFSNLPKIAELKSGRAGCEPWQFPDCVPSVPGQAASEGQLPRASSLLWGSVSEAL